MLDLNSRNNDASFTLDLVRVFAAQLVCVFHATAFFKVSWVRLPHAPPLQNFGVCLFFVLSGFVIAHTLVRKSRDPHYRFREYAIDRFARIYAGLIPALVFVALADLWLQNQGLFDRAASHELSTFLGNLFMLQGVNTPVFGSGGPLWTLSIEFHIYLLIGALFFLLRGGNPRLMLLIAVPFMWLPFKYLSETSLFSLWLGGFGAAFILAQCAAKISSRLWLAMCAISTAIFLYGLLPNTDPFSPFLYGPLVVSFASLIAVTLHTNVMERRWTRGIKRVTRFVADYSYTLYLTHFTIAYGLSKFAPVGRLRWALAVVVICNVVAILIAIPTEMQHRKLGRWLKANLRMPHFLRLQHSKAQSSDVAVPYEQI